MHANPITAAALAALVLIGSVSEGLANRAAYDSCQMIGRISQVISIARHNGIDRNKVHADLANDMPEYTGFIAAAVDAAYAEPRLTGQAREVAIHIRIGRYMSQCWDRIDEKRESM